MTRLCRAIPSTFLALALVDFVVSNTTRLLGDPDSLWHVAVGRWIWAHRQVPTTDLFSHTFHGSPWIAKEWLSQLVFYGVHAAAGWWGIVMMTALSIAGGFVILHEWLLRRLRPSAAMVVTLAAVLLCTVHFVARPHILVLPIIIAWMVALVSAADRRAVPPIALNLLMVLWANMHGSFPFGIAMAGLLACEGIILQAPERRWDAFRRWAIFLAVACAATMVSPYGWQAIMVPLKIGGAETLRYIDEWKPLALDVQGCAALVVLAVVPMLLARNVRVEAVRILAVALVGFMMVRHVRFISLFGIVSAVLVARVMASHWALGLKQRWEPPAFLVGLLIPSLVTVLFYAATIRPAPDPKISPDAAFQAATTLGVTGPVYNDYNFGGYLIAAGVPTFIDGRTDQLFLGDFLPKLQAALDRREDGDFAAILTRYGVQWALVRPRSRDAAHFARLKGWSRLYEDDVASVYVTEK